jgi:hypothetical protein
VALARAEQAIKQIGKKLVSDIYIVYVLRGNRMMLIVPGVYKSWVSVHQEPLVLVPLIHAQGWLHTVHVVAHALMGYVHSLLLSRYRWLIVHFIFSIIIWD